MLIPIATLLIEWRVLIVQNNSILFQLDYSGGSRIFPGGANPKRGRGTNLLFCQMFPKVTFNKENLTGDALLYKFTTGLSLPHHESLLKMCMEHMEIILHTVFQMFVDFVQKSKRFA